MPKNANFSFEKFSVDMLKTIDSIRSQSTLKGQPVAAEPTESRISALYRAIGLPAVRESKKEDKLENTNLLDPANNLNVFESNISENILNQLQRRESVFRSVITDEEIETFLDANNNSLNDGVGIPRGSTGGDTAKRTRGPLFPLLVNANLQVLPQAKRIAGAFQSETQRTYGREIYRRPLIETFIVLSLKGNAATNSENQNRIREDFGFLSLDSFENIRQNIADNIRAAKDSLNPFVEETIRLLDPIRARLDTRIVPSVSFIAQGNPRLQEPEENVKELDVIEQQKLIKEEIKNSQLLLLDYDDNAQQAINQVKNTRETILLSDFLQVINTKDSTKEKKENKEIQNKVLKGNQKLKDVFRRLDLVLGTFSGLSGVDVLILFESLFEMQTEELLGLINQQAQERARNIYQSAIPKSIPDFNTSIGILQEKVSTKYQDLTDRINKSSKHQEKEENRKSGNGRR